MRESELLSENHRSHALEWRSEDTCLHCLMEVICSNPGTKMSIHRRFALATFIQKLSPDVTHAPKPHQDLSSKNLARLLQKNRNVSSQVLTVLLDTLATADLVDLAVEAVYRLYHKVLRDETVLDNVLTHCIQKMGENLLHPEKWVPYLSVMQRLAQLNPTAVALALSQNEKLQNEMVEHLSDHLSEFVALHVVSLLDPIVRSEERTLIGPSRRSILMLQLAHLLQNAQCQQLQCAVLGFAPLLWAKEDLQQDSVKIQQLLVATVNGLKRIMLRSSPEFQVAALQVLDSLLLKCRQLTDEQHLIAVLLEQLDLGEMVFDVLYSCHLPLLEFALRCLHHLSSSPSFFHQRCIILGVEPLLRVIPHLAGSNASALSGGLLVAYAVHLLSDMLSKYDGEETLLERSNVVLENGRSAFDVASQIASMALHSCAFHLEMAGACLAAALLNRKNLPVPVPVNRVVELISRCVESLAPEAKKWRSETSKEHLRAVTGVLLAATSLIVHLTDDPRARLSSYNATTGNQLASSYEPLDKLIELIIATIDKLISAFQQVDSDPLWKDFFTLLVQLASGSAVGASYVEGALKEAGLLSRCFGLRERTAEAADDLLTWFLARTLISGNLATLRGLVRSIPVSTAEWGDWISRDKSAPFGAKCSALILLYQLELCETSKKSEEGDVFYVGEHADAILSAIGELMLTRPPCDMEDPDLLRSVWFLIAMYSRGGELHEASKAFVHLVKWLQPNNGFLLPWLRRIYTPHLCLMRWAFAVKEIALYMGSYMILLWIDDDDEGAGRQQTLTEMCRNDDEQLLLTSLFDLAFHEEARVSCCVAGVLERVAEESDAMRSAIGRMIKYNIPRFLRLTDVNDDNSSSRLVASLRLLCRMADVTECSSSWRDPAIIAALVSFLPRTTGEQQTVKLDVINLWMWSCRYLKNVVTRADSASHRVVAQIVMENRTLLQFIDKLFQRDDSVWKDASELVAALATFHHLHHLKVVCPIRVSINRLARKLTAGLVGIDVDAAESLDVILQLLDYGLFQAKEEIEEEKLIIDPSFDGQCSDEMCALLEHLWATLLNWTMRCDPASGGSSRLFRSLSQLMRFCQRYLPDEQFALLTSQPWNYFVLEEAVRLRSADAIQFATALIQRSKTYYSGNHPWSVQLEELTTTTTLITDS